MSRKLKAALILLPLAVAAFLLWYRAGIDYINKPHTSPQNACINNLRLIDMAKQQWAIKNNKTNGPVTWNDIIPCLAEEGINVETVRCPSGGVYTLGDIGRLPKCSIEGHYMVP